MDQRTVHTIEQTHPGHNTPSRDQVETQETQDTQDTMSTLSVPVSEGQKIPDDVLYYMATSFIDRVSDIAKLRRVNRQLAGLLEEHIYYCDVVRIIRSEYIRWRPRFYDNKDLDDDDLDDEPDDPDGIDVKNSEDDNVFESLDETSYAEKRAMAANRVPCYDTYTPALHWAAKNGDMSALRTIIKVALRFDPYYLDIPNNNSETALSIAAKFGHVDVMRELVDAGVFVDSPGFHYGEGLQETFSRRHGQWQQYYEYQTRFSIPLTRAIIERQEAAAVFLAQRTEHLGDAAMSLRKDVFPPLHLASRMGMTKVVKILLSRGQDCTANGAVADINDPNEPSPLYYAALTEDNHEVIDLLFQYGAKLKYEGEKWCHSALLGALRAGCYRNALYLLTRKDPDHNDTGKIIRRAREFAFIKDIEDPVTEALTECCNQMPPNNESFDKSDDEPYDQWDNITI